MFKRPNTVICTNCDFCKINKRLWTDFITKNEVVLVFQIVLFIIFFLRVYYWIRIVKGEIETRAKISKILIDFLLTGARSAWIRLILTFLYHNMVPLIHIRSILPKYFIIFSNICALPIIDIQFFINTSGMKLQWSFVQVSRGTWE